MGGLNRQRRLKEGTSGRLIELLRRGALTIDEMATSVGLTRTAVRAQVATLERDGAIEERGVRRGPSKPARLYGVTAEAELLLSRAYIPILTQLLHVLARRLNREELDSIMHDVGRSLMSGAAMPQGSLKERVLAASLLLYELGGPNDVQEENEIFVIRGHGCPLAAATLAYPEACTALESLLSEFVGGPVTKCCDQYNRKRCCFEIAGNGTGFRNQTG